MIQTVLRGMILAFALASLASIAQAQQYAALVMDARTGKVIHAVNADSRVHPASLTKMMTLYIVFDEIRRGRMSLEQKVTVSQNAASEPPSRLGLRAGQKIEVRYLIRAAAIKSANDAATALGEAVAGSEAAFAERMNQYARAMGMTRTTFKNANGLTRDGHLSTARDMAIVGRRLIYDFPQYYNIFSRNSTSAGIATVQNTNRRLLDAYPGADGIKTGYTKAAGFNLVSSAHRGNQRVIVALMGGKCSGSRNAEVARLMDVGFAKMPQVAKVQAPAPLRTAAAPRRPERGAAARPWSPRPNSAPRLHRPAAAAARARGRLDRDHPQQPEHHRRDRRGERRARRRPGLARPARGPRPGRPARAAPRHRCPGADRRCVGSASTFAVAQSSQSRPRRSTPTSRRWRWRARAPAPPAATTGGCSSAPSVPRATPSASS